MTVAGDSPLTRPGLVALWAAPRSRSTAVFRYMVEHGGLVALHEPFDNIGDSGSTEVNGRPVSDPAELITTFAGPRRNGAGVLKETTRSSSERPCTGHPASVTSGGRVPAGTRG
jgi:hypothetical protein